MNQTQGIRANEKPVENDFSYVYAENKDKGFIKVTKAMMKVLLGVATNLSELVNDKGFVDNTVSNLKNYYLKTETYSKEELDDKIALIPKFSVKVVYALPFDDISETTIYLVPANDGTENLYTEYINVNGLWEILGTQKVPKVEVTKESIEAALGYTPADNAELSKLSDTVNDLKQNGTGTTTLIEPMEDDIPKVFIDGVIPTTKDDVLAEMTYISKTEEFHAYLKIKCQGSSSMSYSKKNFTIKMYSDEARKTKLKKSFKDWGFEQNKYVLKANFIDHSHARNIVSARLWGEVVASRSDYELLPTELKTSPNNGAIDGFPIKVYTNGTYQGIYTWNIGKDDWMWGMDEDNSNHVLMCAETNTNDTYAETPCNFRKLWNGGTDWEVEVGTNNDIVKQGLNNLISCVKDTDDETFVATIGSCLDLQSAIDYWIHQYVICGLDGLAKNMLLGTYDLQTEKDSNQLLVYPYYRPDWWGEGSHVETGITYTDNGNGSIKMQGTATDKAYYQLFPNQDGRRLPLKAGTYTLSVNSCEKYMINGNIRIADGTTVQPIRLGGADPLQKTFTLDTDGELYMFITIDSGVTVDETVYPMLNKGSVALPFESYTDISPKWIMGAYDMDSTFGLYWDGSRFVSSDYRCPEDYQEKYSLLFERITTLYPDRVKERYTELRKTVYSVSNMFNHFERFVDVIGKDLYAEDLEIYTGIPSGNTNNIKQIRDYIKNRLNYCDMQFGLIEESDIIYQLAQPMVFDGTSTYLDTGVQLFNESKDSTVFIDFESGEQSETQDAILMISSNVNSLGNADLSVKKSVGNNYVVFRTSNVEPIIEDVANGNWSHSWARIRKIALVFKNGLFEYGRYYITNESQPRYLEKKDGETFTANTASLVVGARESEYTPDKYVDFWKGTVNDFRVYNRALSEEEVNALMLQG